MRTTLLLATCVATVLVIFAAIDLHAQNRGPTQPVRGPVAVIDVGYIFKHHAGFTQASSRMKQDMEVADAGLKKEGTHINAMIEKLKTFKPGTPDYKKLEEDITNLQAGQQVHKSLQQREFLDRRAKLYYTVYQEVNDAVRYYGDRNGISVVLQFSSEAIDPNNPNSVMNAINNPIVYQRGVDITLFILDELNRNNPVGGTANPKRPGTTR